MNNDWQTEADKEAKWVPGTPGMTAPKIDGSMGPVMSGVVVGDPSMEAAGYDSDDIKPYSPDVKNADTDLNISASTENLSAKYKYPRNSQDTVPEDSSRINQDTF